MVILISIAFLVIPFLSIFLWLVLEINDSKRIYRVALGALSIISVAYFSVSVKKKEIVALQKQQEMLVEKRKRADEK
ncbi:hypothetical protein [Microbulbifer sp. JMSA008]|uniref:hypothetical protein n=1 Tax=Microbulbifer sp. JMSA008 TaxID=3243373 RepID=UPI00403916C6